MLFSFSKGVRGCEACPTIPPPLKGGVFGHFAWTLSQLSAWTPCLDTVHTVHLDTSLDTPWIPLFECGQRTLARVEAGGRAGGGEDSTEGGRHGGTLSGRDDHFRPIAPADRMHLHVAQAKVVRHANQLPPAGAWRKDLDEAGRGGAFIFREWAGHRPRFW